MNTFKKIVGAPFRAAGWVAGQVKNGYDAATKAVEPVATKATAAVKKAVVKVRAAAKSAGSAVWGATKTGVKALGTAAYMIVYTVRQLVLMTGALFVVSFSLVTLAALMVGMMFVMLVVDTVKLIGRGLSRLGTAMRGDLGLQVADFLHYAGVMAAMAAGIWALFALVWVVAPVGVPAAQIALMSQLALGAMVTAAALSVMAAIIEGVNRDAVVQYDPPARRVIPVNIVDGVVCG